MAYPVTPITSRPFSETRLDNPREVRDFVLSSWEGRSRHMASLEQQWVENISFFLGHQWTQYDTRMRRMVSRKRPQGSVRLVINRLLPMVQRKVAAVLRGHPTWKVRPATNDYDDIAVARLSSKILQGYWQSILGMPRKLKKLAIWCETTGFAALKVTWDDFLGPPMKIPTQGMMGMDQGGDPLQALLQVFGQEEGSQSISGFLGDARVDVRSPFELFFDPGSTDIEDASHLIETKAVSLSWLRDRYPGKRFQADAPESNYETRYFMGKITEAAEQPQLYESRSENRDLALMHQLWTWPSKKYPYGTFAVVANDQILEIGENQYDFRKPPYAFFTSIDVPGQIHGTCWLRQAISPQMALNMSRSHMEELRRKMGYPKWFVPDGSGVQKSELLGDEAAEFVQHTVGLAPTAHYPQSLPDWLSRLPGEARGDFDDTVSQHPASMGQQPGSVRSGSAIDTLVETDAAANLPTLDNYRHGLAEAGSMLLSILSTHITSERLVRLAGEEFEVESFFFTGGDLVGGKDTPGVDYTDVVVEMVNGGPLTSAGRLNQIDRLVERMILHPVNDREKIFKILDLGWDEPYLDETRAERGNVSRENVEMMRGELPNINPFDNDMFHIVGHRGFQKLPEYRKASPLSQQIFERHILLHVQRYQLAMQKRAQLEPQQGPASSQAPAQQRIGAPNAS